MLDDEFVAAARAGEARELFSTYPEYGALREALARYAGVVPEQIFVTPGSDAAIEHIARAYVGGGGEALLPVPTFYGYESILARVGARVTPLTYTEQDGHFVFPLEETLVALAKGSAKVLFLCHPNNPLGSPLSATDMEALIAAARGSDTLIVSDEAYFEFSDGTTFLPYLSELPNLIVIRTLSKSFGLAGARVGYAIADPEIVKQLQRSLLPWPVTHPSVAAALVLLERADAVGERRAIVIEARDRFADALSNILGIVVYPSQTNFVLVRLPHAEQVRDGFAAQGIQVAPGEQMTQFPEAKKLLKDTLRIATPSPSDSPIVLGALAALVGAPS